MFIARTLCVFLLLVATAHAGRRPANPAPAPAGHIPENAISSGALDGHTDWKWNHDPDTPGTSDGSSKYPVADLSPDNAVRQFDMSFTNRGGELYHLQFARDDASTHFIYDTYVYLSDPAQVQNVELDMNQVIPDGRTVIFGTQCAGDSGTWQYTTVVQGKTRWNNSSVPCTPKTWVPRAWHHVQIASHRDQAGVVTYDWVGVDGEYHEFQNAGGPSALALGWHEADLLLNFQLDGVASKSGSVTAYLDRLTIYRW